MAVCLCGWAGDQRCGVRRVAHRINRIRVQHRPVPDLTATDPTAPLDTGRALITPGDPQLRTRRVDVHRCSSPGPPPNANIR